MAKNAAAETSLYAVSVRMAGLQESVAEKKAKLEFLKMIERVHSVVGAQINIGGINETLQSATKILEELPHSDEKLSEKAQEVEDVASSLAEVVGSEKMLLEECADLLHLALNMQVFYMTLRCTDGLDISNCVGDGRQPEGPTLSPEKSSQKQNMKIFNYKIGQPMDTRAAGGASSDCGLQLSFQFTLAYS
ncbi:hypothetical protein C2845_PM17G10960 [Panicum miliaceum]|uniref:Uncharacterized protein n=1 Tax=Panicum miliaceum TaxID=4540 RepID=A0A3L6PZB3_PANMI|nr:hypothetical protein C2845_PM17G10960 [Panicum miliaceum]